MIPRIRGAHSIFSRCCTTAGPISIKCLYSTDLDRIPQAAKKRSTRKGKQKQPGPLPGTSRYSYDNEKKMFLDKYQNSSAANSRKKSGYTLKTLKEEAWKTREKLWNQLNQFPLLILLKTKGAEADWNSLVVSLENRNKEFNEIEKRINFKVTNVNDEQCELIYDSHIPYSNKFLKDTLLLSNSKDIAKDIELLDIKNQKPSIEERPYFDIEDPNHDEHVRSWEAEYARLDRVRVLSVTELGFNRDLELFDLLERNADKFQVQYAILNPVEFPFLNSIFAEFGGGKDSKGSPSEDVDHTSFNRAALINNFKELGASLGLVKAHLKSDGLIILSKDPNDPVAAGYLDHA